MAVYDADRGTDTGRYRADDGFDPRARDELIWKLFLMRWPHRKIAARVGMSPGGVNKAIKRIAAGRAARDALG
ncbi:hypothetical protein [Mycobacterium paragordonae]|uniref:hypothetical protein n=1 Tax=Mycobacterium paragordonae TaxID=1389713 RepID=UPI0012E290A5|nr:hypothetical protein [Mycobacterium paragordonae]